MKNLLLLLVASTLIIYNVSAQRAASFEILDSNGVVVTGTTINVAIIANTNYKDKLKIKNLTNNDITYRVERTYLTTPYCTGSYIFYCAAGMCFLPDSVMTHTTLNSLILANETLPSGPFTYGIEPHYDVGPTCCNEDVLYKIINVSNPADTARVIYHYQCVNSVQESSVSYSFYAFPNPANKLLHINYLLDNSSNNEVIFYDMLGKEIRKITLKNNKGIETVDVSDLKAGVYFYTLIVNNEMKETKKIIIGTEK